jgi:hypothetical protein
MGVLTAVAAVVESVVVGAAAASTTLVPLLPQRGY